MRFTGLLIALVVLACQPHERAAGPIVLVDDAGDTVRFAHPATRVVSLIPATTEILFAIGDGPVLVGRTRWCDYPAAAAQVTDVGDGLNPNLEAVVAQKPDLVLLYRSASNAAAVEQLQALGIATLQVTVDRLSDVPRIARLLGRATGREASADSLTTVFTAAIEQATIHTEAPVRVLIVAWDQPPMGIGAGSFLSEMVERAGGANVFGDIAAPSAQISIEAAVARNPDALLVSSDGPPSIASRPEWRTVPAVRDGRFVHVTSSAFNRPSPRAPEAIEELAAKFRTLKP